LSGALLTLHGISKTFAGVHALRGVSFDLHAGEVHALVGDNGAGKSTLIKVVTGAEAPDTGTVMVAGHTLPRMNPATARSLGVAAIYQHPVLFPSLTVAENIALPLEGRRLWRRVDWRARRRRAVQLFELVGAAIDPDRDAETLSMPERQLVEIVKALDVNARVLVMDEPTASLTDREIDRLLDVVRRLRACGAGIVYISHKLDEVFAIADRVTVLRDGESVATRRCGELDTAELVRLMVGREQVAFGGAPSLSAGRGPAAVGHGSAAVGPESAARPKRRHSSFDRVALELRGVSNRARGVRPTTLAVRRGEIVGVAGLLGSGRTELAETIFGLTPSDAGDMVVNGAAAAIRCPADAIRLRVGYVPEDRQLHGVIAEMSIAANTTLSNLSAVSTLGLVDRSAERRTAAKFVGQLRIKTPSVGTSVGELSGGNQQKVALARWLSIEPAVLILDEPTQGIDIAAKAEIHDIIERLAEQGVAIVLISSELPELLAMADRVAVMRGGALAGILESDEATPQAVMALALGHAA
jgi:rhamnose transport system ATP-binding protein